MWSQMHSHEPQVSEQPPVEPLLRKSFQGPGLGAGQHHLPAPEDNSAEDFIIKPQPTSAHFLSEALRLVQG